MAETDESSQTPQQIAGSAVGGVPIYIAGQGEVDLNSVDPEGEIYAVARINPAAAIETGLDAVREFMRAVGGRVEQIAETARPDEVTLTFSITFDVQGKVVIPVLVTGETGASTGLSVSAVWHRSPSGERNE